MFDPRHKTRNSPSMAVADSAFPTRQLFVLAVCRICEPIAFMSIFPYIYYMISSFHMTSNDREIAIYAGMVTSAFTLAEFSTGLMWGRISDAVGRKPILLTGLAGTGLSMIVFGFSSNLKVALLARALGGLLNGNIGVLQTTVAEVVKVKEHQPRAYAIMPFVWCLGSIIGSGLGGTLAEPVKNYPSVFASGTIFESYPFLLPNLICAFMVLVGLVVGILFLEETHQKHKDRRDYGRELGKWILDALNPPLDAGPEYCALRASTPSQYDAFGMEKCQMERFSSDTLREDLVELSTDTVPDYDIVVPQKRSFRQTFNRQITLTIVAYGILAFHTISFEQLMPVLLSMDESNAEVHLPFKFLGGFGLSTSTIGAVLSSQGVYQMISQMVLFPLIVRKFGSLRTFQFVAICYPLLYFIAPYLVLLPSNFRMPGLFAILIFKVTFQSLAYPSNALLLTNSAPSLLVLGTINGVAASTASLCRALGPTFSGFVQSAGLSFGYSGIAWWTVAIIAILGAFECRYLVEPSSLLPSALPMTSEKYQDVEREPFSVRESFETSSSETTLVETEPATTIINNAEVLTKA